MPSLFNTTVAANYGKMTKQQTYGIGQAFSNFGTRQLRLIKVTATANSVTVDFTDSSATANSAFTVAVKALQTCAEVYNIFTPGTSGFLALVAEDTINDSTSSNKNVADRTTGSGYGYAETAISDALAQSAANGGPAKTTPIVATITLVDVGSTGIALADQS